MWGCIFICPHSLPKLIIAHTAAFRYCLIRVTHCVIKVVLKPDSLVDSVRFKANRNVFASLAGVVSFVQ